MPRCNSSKFKSVLLAAAIGFTTSCAPAVAQSFDQFTVSNETNTQTLAYPEFQKMLEVFSTSQRGRSVISYDAVRTQGVEFMPAYLDALQKVNPAAFNKDEQLAYWLNLRNFALIKSISDQSSTRNFSKLRGTPSAPGPLWTDKLVTVSGQSLSIQDIESIIFSNWSNPDVIYGLYQGTKDGPGLLGQPFTGPTVVAQLREVGARFVANSKTVKVKKDTAEISQYYDWYKSLAFNNDDGAVKQHLISIASEKKASALSGASEIKFRPLKSSFEESRTRQQVGTISSSRGYTGSGS